MILLLVGRALAACDPAAVLDELEARGPQEAYLCVAEAEAGKDLLLARIGDQPADHPRASRALVLWLLERSDRAMEPEVIARLTPADRRLLADGIRARRGRVSPSPEHAAVFQQLSWYAPVERYTDGRLLPVDRANLALVDPRVHAPVADVAEADAPPPRGTTRVVDTSAPRCGCASANAGGLGTIGLGVLAALFGASRRRPR